MGDLDLQQCTIEEREEYEPHISHGTVVYAGVDYEKILRRAEKETDVILWDGGNNDTSFYVSDLEIVVVDPHRPGHELSYFPGEVNLRRADVIVINKVDTAEQHDIETVRQNIKLHNPKAAVFEMACRVSIREPYLVKGRRVLVVEDGPTLTHGEMPYGAGVVAARQYEAAELVDPRPYAVGSIRGTYDRYRHLTNLLPAMGYSAMQRHELEETIRRTPCDLVLVATPIDLARVIKIDRPNLRVTYEVEELAKPGLAELLARFAREHETGSGNGSAGCRHILRIASRLMGGNPARRADRSFTTRNHRRHWPRERRACRRPASSCACMVDRTAGDRGLGLLLLGGTQIARLGVCRGGCTSLCCVDGPMAGAGSRFAGCDGGDGYRCRSGRFHLHRRPGWSDDAGRCRRSRR